MSSATASTSATLMRGGRAIRAALARRFLLKLKRATHRSRPEPYVPVARTALVVAPHMDDEVIGCGGTLLQLIRAGTAVHVLFASDSSGDMQGARGSALTAVRRTEAQQVAEMMGFVSIAELGFPDGHLHQHETALAASISRAIAEHQPDLLFCPFPADAHSDHMAVSAAVANAARDWRGTVLAYEVWTALMPNAVVDISPVADRKAEAIRLYASQNSAMNFEAGALGLNAWRGLPHGFAHAEAFYRGTAASFERLTRLLDCL